MTSDARGGRSNPPRGARSPRTQVGSVSDLGPALELSTEQLDEAASVTPIDVAAAAAIWRVSAPTPLRDLLDAALQEGE